MADSLRDLVVSLSLNTDNFTRNIKSVNKQIQEAESFFKLAAAGVENFDTSAAGLAARLTTLQRELSLQSNVVEQYQRALTAANAKLQETYGESVRSRSGKGNGGGPAHNGKRSEQRRCS